MMNDKTNKSLSKKQKTTKQVVVVGPPIKKRLGQMGLGEMLPNRPLRTANFGHLQGASSAGQRQNLRWIRQREFEGAWGGDFFDPYIFSVRGAEVLKIFFPNGLLGGRVQAQYQPSRLNGGEC